MGFPQGGVVFQNPDHQLFAETVYDELAFGPKNWVSGGGQIKSRVDGVARQARHREYAARLAVHTVGAERSSVSLSRAR